MTLLITTFLLLLGPTTGNVAGKIIYDFNEHIPLVVQSHGEYEDMYIVMGSTPWDFEYFAGGVRLAFSQYNDIRVSEVWHVFNKDTLKTQYVIGDQLVVSLYYVNNHFLLIVQ